MNLEELQKLEREQWAEVQKLRKLSDQAASAWVETSRKIGQAEQAAEVERLVQERMAQKVQP